MGPLNTELPVFSVIVSEWCDTRAVVASSTPVSCRRVWPGADGSAELDVTAFTFTIGAS